MSSSSAQLVQFLQKEKIRLGQEIKSGRQDVARLGRYIDILADLYWAAQKVEREEDALPVLDQLLKKSIDVIGAGDGSISLLDPQADELIFLIVHGSVRDQLTGFRIPASAGIAGWVIESGEVVTIDDARQDWRFSMQVDEKFSFSTRSMLCVPIVDQEKPIGVIQLLNKYQTQPFDEADTILATILSDVVAKVLVKVRLQAE